MGINDIEDHKPITEPNQIIDDNEVQIGSKKIGFKSVVRMNVGTIITILGSLYLILTTVFTIFYFNLKKDIANNKENESKERDKLYEKVENKIDKLDDVVTKLDKNVGIILDRTSRMNTSTDGQHGTVEQPSLPPSN